MTEPSHTVEKNTGHNVEENTTEKYPKDDACWFFCHPFDKGSDQPKRFSSKADSDFIINIDDEGPDPLVEGRIVHAQGNPSLLYVPLDTTVNSEDIVQNGLLPRHLENEGLYVGERLKIVKKMYDKMSHRLLDQYEGRRWFGDDGCMTTVPNPLKSYWQATTDFPFPNTSADLTTEYVKPVCVGGGVDGAGSETKPTAEHWQLDLNLKGLQFTQHPLYSKEHVLANRLQRLCENYTMRRSTDKATFLQEKLRALRRSKIQMTSESPRSLSSFRAITKQIRKTHRTLSQTIEEDAAQLKNIVSTWQCLKALRAENRCISTSVKLHFQKVEQAVEEGSSVHCDESDTDSDSQSNREREEDANGTFANDDIICNGEGDWLQAALNTRSLMEKAGDAPHFTTFQAKMNHIPFIPVLTMNQPISPDFNCDRAERCRRAELRNRSISVKVFYNGKLVSTTPKSPLDLNFRVHIEEIFNMQVTNCPESLMLEVYEHERFRSTLLAEVYLPIPHRNVLSASAAVETMQFGTQPRVRSSFTKSGADRSLSCLGTAAKLCYRLSWAVDEWGFPKAPPAEPVPMPFEDTIARRINRKQFEWLMKQQFDPNDPENTYLNELIRELTKMEKVNSGGHFRLEQLDCFSTDEQLDRVRRFQLLRLRESLNTPEALQTRPIPLLDTQITRAMMEEYTAGQIELPPRKRDDITADRKWVIQYLQKLISDTEKNLQHMEKKYKLSDIVRERQNAINLLDNIKWGMVKGGRKLKPGRVVVEGVSPTQLLKKGLAIRVNIQSATHLPIRQQTQNFMENRGDCCDLSSGTYSLIHSTHRSSPKLQPFVEVNFRRETFQTRDAEGPDPIWREDFAFVIRSLDGDFSHATLAKVQDDIVIDIFDAVSFQLTERHTLKGCGAHTFFGKQWLGSVTIPFRSLLQQHKLECRVPIRIPYALLGYMWPRDQMDQDQTSFLNVLIALEPPISPKANPSASEIAQKSTWMSPADESKETEQLAYEFDRKCRIPGGHTRLVSFVMNSEGELGLATKFFNPLPPPPGILHCDGDELFEEEELTLLHQRRLAAFVSLIPVLPSPSEVGDYGEMWFTSEQCLDLAIGNRTSLAVLLCNLFLHIQGMKAWVILGSSATENRTAFVYSSHPDCKDLLWDTKDGQHYPLPVSYPIMKVDYLVNWQNVWFYKSKVSSVPHTFQLSDASAWIPLLPEKAQPVSAPQPFAIQYHLPESDPVDVLQSRLEKQLMRSVMEWRSPHPTRWNRKCPVILHTILPQLETDAQQDPAAPSNMEDVAHMVAVQMPDYKVTGVAIRMAFSGMDDAIEKVRHTQIHSTEIPGTEFALAVYIHPYPNSVLAVWVFLTALVRDQKGPYYLPPPCHDEHKQQTLTENMSRA